MPEQSLEARVAGLDSQIQAIMRDVNGLDKLFPSIRDAADVEQKVAILEAEVEHIKLPEQWINVFVFKSGWAAMKASMASSLINNRTRSHEEIKLSSWLKPGSARRDQRR